MHVKNLAFRKLGIKKQILGDQGFGIIKISVFIKEDLFVVNFIHSALEV